MAIYDSANPDKNEPPIVGEQEGFLTQEEALNSWRSSKRNDLGLKFVVDYRTGKTVAFVFDKLSKSEVDPLRMLRSQSVPRDLPKTQDVLVSVGRGPAIELMYAGFTTEQQMVVLLMLADLLAVELGVSKEEFLRKAKEVADNSFVSKTPEFFTKQ